MVSQSTPPVRYVVGFCRSCGAVRYRSEWMGPVHCQHKPGCLEFRRRQRADQARLQEAS